MLNKHPNPEILKDWTTIVKTKRIHHQAAASPEEKPQKEPLAFEAWAPAEVLEKEACELRNLWRDFVSEIFTEVDLPAEKEIRLRVELFELYRRMIFGEALEIWLPQQLQQSEYGFGQGFWPDAYYAGGAPSTLTAPQYLSPRNIMDFEDAEGKVSRHYFRAIRSSHFNLCGQLAVMEALSLPLPEGLRLFYEEVDDRNKDGEFILGNPGMGTYASDLIAFVAAIARRRNEAWTASHHYFSGARYRYDSLQRLVKQGDVIILLVNINPSTSGKGQLGQNGACPHWVVLQSLFELAGRRVARLYNPFMNREEVYLWEKMLEAWEAAEVQSAPRFIWARSQNEIDVVSSGGGEN